MPMSNLELRIYKAEYDLNVVESYGPTIKAAGYDLSTMVAGDMLFLVNRIWGCVRERAWARWRETDGTNPVSLPYLEVLNNMSAAELAAMRAGINFTPMPKRRQP